MTEEAETEPESSSETTNSKLQQQQLPAWQPALTAGTVLPTFFVVGVAFIPIGVSLLYLSSQVKEVVMDYTECKNADNRSCSSVLQSNSNASCVCELNISDVDIGATSWAGPVYLYYGLTNFYQNHRRYAKSRDDRQLSGEIASPPSLDCEPLRLDKVTNNSYAPCGAMANSMFSDRISLRYKEKNSPEVWKDVPLLKTGIAWPSDKKYKFKNPEYERDTDDPEQDWRNLRDAFTNAKLVSPKDWKTPLWELDKENPDNNGFLNEDLIVWMRAAIAPNFRKLHRKIDHQNVANTDFATGLPHDKDYQLLIEYNYDVVQFSGTKKIILATSTYNKNTFLGVAYILVGFISFIMGVVLLLNHLRFGTSSQHIPDIGPRTPYH